MMGLKENIFPKEKMARCKDVSSKTKLGQGKDVI
jgi:hypothetical protein